MFPRPSTSSRSNSRSWRLAPSSRESTPGSIRHRVGTPLTPHREASPVGHPAEGLPGRGRRRSIVTVLCGAIPSWARSRWAVSCSPRSRRGSHDLVQFRRFRNKVARSSSSTAASAVLSTRSVSTQSMLSWTDQHVRPADPRVDQGGSECHLGSSHGDQGIDRSETSDGGPEALTTGSRVAPATGCRYSISPATRAGPLRDTTESTAMSGPGQRRPIFDEEGQSPGRQPSTHVAL